MSPAPSWFGCADSARLRADPLVGTAPYALGWLLIEHPGPWRPDALGGSGIAESVRHLLAATARASGSRILLIRRPGRQQSADVRHWAAVSTASGTTWGTWEEDGDLVAAARALSDSTSGARVRDPILLVCTHGLHDTCCAVRGRPVTAALARLWPALTWECSHVGGDRFAANVIVLPDGTHYGNLDAESALTTVREHLAGRLGLPYLRGLAGFPPVAQAAVAAAHETYGPWGPADIAVVKLVELQAHRLWEIELESPRGALRGLVSASRRVAAKLTCRAALDTTATEYEVTDLLPAGPHG